MSRDVYEIKGYALVLDKLLFVTQVFEAPEGEGYQFNLRFEGEVRITPKFPTRNEAELQRSLLIKALKG